MTDDHDAQQDACQKSSEHEDKLLSGVIAVRRCLSRWASVCRPLRGTVDLPVPHTTLPAPSKRHSFLRLAQEGATILSIHFCTSLSILPLNILAQKPRVSSMETESSVMQTAPFFSAAPEN